MAIGKIYEMSTSFKNYSYIINGVGGIGKTTLAYELGKIATGNNKGTLVLTIGSENIPTHIEGLYGDIAPDFPTLMKYAKELAKDRNTEYSETKFIAIDSLDELFRITENYVVAEYNNTPNGKKRPAKSISGAYGGFQKGENRVVDLAIKVYEILKKAGYQLILIGHTKVKNETDALTGIVYEKLTCNLENKYYTALKDKVNLVATCYNEKEVIDIKEEENAFNKKMQNKGKLVGEKRVIIFRDNDNAIDTKTHFPHIVNKIGFSAEGFVKAVEDALIAKKNGDKVDIKPYFRPTIEETSTEDITEENSFEEIEDENSFEDIDNMIDNALTETEETSKENTDKTEEKDSTEDINVLRKEVSDKFKKADNNAKVKAREIINAKGVTLMSADIDTLKQILEIL